MQHLLRLKHYKYFIIYKRCTQILEEYNIVTDICLIKTGLFLSIIDNEIN